MSISEALNSGAQLVLSWARDDGKWEHRTTRVVYMNPNDLAIVKPGSGPWILGATFTITVERDDYLRQQSVRLKQRTENALLFEPEGRQITRSYAHPYSASRALVNREGRFQIVGIAPAGAPLTPGQIAISMASQVEHPCVIVNLSETGLLMRAAEPVEVGTYVVVRVLLPTGEELCLAGAVVRQGVEGYGISFGTVTTCDRLRIADFVGSPALGDS